MTDDLYERYKEALRVGHVAVLRGALDDALAAYRNAASIAPSRALPHTSLGGVLLRLGHLEEALVEYAAAVARAPHDEGALLGQAEALTMAGQRVDAALALDHVAEIQEASGRLPESADTLRRALELHESTERSRHQRGLIREIRLSAGDQAAEQLLAKALRLRDEPSDASVETAWPSLPPSSSHTGLRLSPVPLNQVTLTSEPAEAAVEPEPSEEMSAAQLAGVIMWPATDTAPTLVEDESRTLDQRGRTHAPAPAASVSDWPAVDLAQLPTWKGASAPIKTTAADWVVAVDSREADSGDDLEPAEPARLEHAPAEEAKVPAELEPILAAVGVMEGNFDADTPLGTVDESQHQPTGDELLEASEAAELSGDSTTLRSLLLWTARAYAREGRFEAGLDATHRLLARAPGDVDAHLVLVELYVARDWNNLAAEKLALLGRLAELNNDQATRARLCKVATRVFPHDERLASLCA
ncbi:MAG TPA: hypothetical protein VF337_07825 [Candidatus Limnocylindrales bacterium]